MNDTLQQIATVIERTNEVEDRMSDILSLVIRPVTDQYGFLREALLHNTYLNVGQKLRLLQRIADYWKWRDIDFGPFHALVELRNGFAHTPTNRHVLLIWQEPGSKSYIGMGSEKVIDRKHKSSWRDQERGAAFDEFLRVSNRCLDILTLLGDRISEKTPEARGITVGQVQIENQTTE